VDLPRDKLTVTAKAHLLSPHAVLLLVAKQTTSYLYVMFKSIRDAGAATYHPCRTWGILPLSCFLWTLRQRAHKGMYYRSHLLWLAGEYTYHQAEWNTPAKEHL